MANLSKKDIRKIKSLYCRQGYSVREIAEFFKVSIDSVYSFMKRNNIPRRSFFDSNRIRFERQSPSFVLKKRLTEKERQLKLVGIMLYWTEGSKSNPRTRSWMIDFANSNPEMIKLFLKFLREICGVKKKRLRLYLYTYADQNIEALRKYWHKVTKISLKQFSKPYIRKDFLPEKSGKMKYGLVHVRYSDKKLLLQIEKWIDEYLKRTL